MPLRAPDQTQRVACAACGSLFDAEAGRFSFLKSLKQADPRMFIPLGARRSRGGHPAHAGRQASLDASLGLPGKGVAGNPDLER